MTRLLSLAALAALLVSAPSQAADPAPAHAAMPPGHPAQAAAPAAAPAPVPVPVKAGAADLAKLLAPKENWTQSMTALAQDAQAQLQSHPGSKLTFPPDFGAKVRAEVETVLPYDDLIKMHAQALSAAYSEKELADLLAFYKTPTGQKYLKVMPDVSGKVELQTQQRFQQKMPEVMSKLTSGLKHPDPKNDPANAKPAMPKDSNHGG